MLVSVSIVKGFISISSKFKGFVCIRGQVVSKLFSDKSNYFVSLDSIFAPFFTSVNAFRYFVYSACYTNVFSYFIMHPWFVFTPDDTFLIWNCGFCYFHEFTCKGIAYSADIINDIYKFQIYL